MWFEGILSSAVLESSADWENTHTLCSRFVECIARVRNLLDPLDKQGKVPTLNDIISDTKSSHKFKSIDKSTRKLDTRHKEKVWWTNNFSIYLMVSGVVPTPFEKIHGQPSLTQCFHFSLLSQILFRESELQAYIQKHPKWCRHQPSRPFSFLFHWYLCWPMLVTCEESCRRQRWHNARQFLYVFAAMDGGCGLPPFTSLSFKQDLRTPSTTLTFATPSSIATTGIRNVPPWMVRSERSAHVMSSQTLRAPPAASSSSWNTLPTSSMEMWFLVKRLPPHASAIAVEAVPKQLLGCTLLTLAVASATQKNLNAHARLLPRKVSSAAWMNSILPWRALPRTLEDLLGPSNSKSWIFRLATWPSLPSTRPPSAQAWSQLHLPTSWPTSPLRPPQVRRPNSQVNSPVVCTKYILFRCIHFDYCKKKKWNLSTVLLTRNAFNILLLLTLHL